MTFLANLFLAAVATVLGNWHNVLRVISMASSKCCFVTCKSGANIGIVKIAKPKESEEREGEQQKKPESENALPQTLVRIPTDHAPMLQQSSSSGGGSGE